MIVFDLETIPNPDHGMRLRPEEVKVPGNYSNPQSIEAYRNDPANQSVAHRALDPLFCRVVSAAWSRWTYDEGEDRASDSFMQVDGASHKHDERHILDALSDFVSAFPDDALVSHNGLRFDYLVVYWAAVRHGMWDLARRMWPGKWGDDMHVDTMIRVRQSGFVSLEDMCKSLGIVHPTAGCGSEVFRWWKDGKIDLIRGHNIDDVRAQNMVTLTLVRSGAIRPRR